MKLAIRVCAAVRGILRRELCLEEQVLLHLSPIDEAELVFARAAIEAEQEFAVFRSSGPQVDARGRVGQLVIQRC
jgi:hypothetical protein